MYKFVITGQSTTSTVVKYMTKEQSRQTTLNVILRRIKNSLTATNNRNGTQKNLEPSTRK